LVFGNLTAKLDRRKYRCYYHAKTQSVYRFIAKQQHYLQRRYLPPSTGPHRKRRGPREEKRDEYGQGHFDTYGNSREPKNGQYEKKRGYPSQDHREIEQDAQGRFHGSVPDILNVPEYLGEKIQHNMKHPPPEKKGNNPKRKELGGYREGHVAYGCYSLKQRYRDADHQACQQGGRRHKQGCFQRVSAEVKYEITAHFSYLV